MGGSGLIGLLTAAVLEGMGVTTIVSELAQARKERAISSGVADEPLDPSQEDVPARVLELIGGKGADVALARCRCLLGVRLLVCWTSPTDRWTGDASP